MIPLFSKKQFDNAKHLDLLTCQCVNCNQPFNQTKKNILIALNPNQKFKNNFCSVECSTKHRKTIKLKYNKPDSLKKKCPVCQKEFEDRYDKKIFCSTTCHAKSKEKPLLDVECVNCNTIFQKKQSEIKRSNNHFCSKTCSASYNNKNKTKGNRRSKLEIWLEEQLTKLYPNLPIDFNKKDAIGSELDIYIPSLNLAFELNGVFHYEPIYGTNKLNQIQENDKSKSLACHEAKIDLCIIDTSGQKYVKPSTSQKYLDIIINIINERM